MNQGFVEIPKAYLETVDGSTILISGASGMLGGFLARSFVDSSDFYGVGPTRIVLIARRKPDASSLIFDILDNPRVDLRLCDVLSIPANLPNIDHCVHAASPAAPALYRKDPVAVFKTNVMGLERIIESRCFKYGSKFVLISSGEVYGPQQPLPVSEDYGGLVTTTDPRSVYAESKRAAEALLLAYSESSSFDAHIVRLFHTFGPGVKKSDTRIFGTLLWSVARGEPMEVRSNGLAVRTFLDLGDACRGITAIMAVGQPSRAYNCGSPDPVSIRQFVETVQAMFPADCHPIDFDSLPSIDSYAIVPDVSALCELGWNPEVSLSDMILKTVSWMRSRL